MTALISEITLRHGVPERSEKARFAVIHVYAPDDQPVTVFLVVAAEEEHEFELGIGDTFPVRDETWILDRVDGLGTGGNWRVVLRKADPTTTEG
ncbi:hypothetical protein OG920_26985 [Streptomyces europaeiscabiei]|uniref:DUF6406 domain-containing protein n=1 Tax=Streptomyces TaxID=1883 RepID=UPI00117F1535|nr:MULTISPECIES: DUF6406 domain-containing protein [Streptomyces]MDX3618852.1 hypothetical protein [Streptomyces europaeiscabiei]MDX3633605.1 hypothetical protein [Streptomyces europaeiscabiei]MDX3651096.1 hypothetical protein [Streptomyces europaeiscabiei]